jgi:hypothetical protein
MDPCLITYAAAGGGGGKRGTGRLSERPRDVFALVNASVDDEKSEGVEKKKKTRAGDISPASLSRRSDNPAHKNLIKDCTRDSVMRGPLPKPVIVIPLPETSSPRPHPTETPAPFRPGHPTVCSPADGGRSIEAKRDVAVDAVILPHRSPDPSRCLIWQISQGFLTKQSIRR